MSTVTGEVAARLGPGTVVCDTQRVPRLLCLYRESQV
jgi:hypothetical protein